MGPRPSLAARGVSVAGLGTWGGLPVARGGLVTSGSRAVLTGGALGVATEGGDSRGMGDADAVTVLLAGAELTIAPASSSPAGMINSTPIGSKLGLLSSSRLAHRISKYRRSSPRYLRANWANVSPSTTRCRRS